MSSCRHYDITTLKSFLFNNFKFYTRCSCFCCCCCNIERVKYLLGYHVMSIWIWFMRRGHGFEAQLFCLFYCVSMGLTTTANWHDNKFCKYLNLLQMCVLLDCRQTKISLPFRFIIKYVLREKLAKRPWLYHIYCDFFSYVKSILSLSTVTHIYIDLLSDYSYMLYLFLWIYVKKNVKF